MAPKNQKEGLANRNMHRMDEGGKDGKGWQGWQRMGQQRMVSAGGNNRMGQHRSGSNRISSGRGIVGSLVLWVNV